MNNSNGCNCVVKFIESVFLVIALLGVLITLLDLIRS